MSAARAAALSLTPEQMAHDMLDHFRVLALGDEARLAQWIENYFVIRLVDDDAKTA
jgi:hypothetical protein